MTEKLLFILTIILCCFVTQGMAQSDLKFNHYGKESGLTQASAHCLLEDSRGYLWVGTVEGLNRFNGSEFVTFLPDHPDSSLAGPEVNDIAEDAFGNIWVGTNRGLSRYDVRTQEFRNFRWTKEQQDVLPTNTITSLLVDSNHIWLGTNFGLGRINTVDFTTEIWRNDTLYQDSILRGNVYSMLLHRDSLFLLTSVGISMLDKRTDRFTNFELSKTQPDFKAIEITDMVVDSSGTFWASSIESGYGRLLTNWKDPLFEAFPVGSAGGPAHRLVNDIKLGPDGTLILATYEGLTIVSTLDSVRSKHCAYDGSEGSLSNNRCYEVLLDEAGRIWVGTASGLDVHDPYFNQFRTLSHAPNNPQSIADDMVYAIEEDSFGNLWVGTYNQGITIIDLDGNYHHIGVEQGLSTSQIIALEELSPGTMWAGTFGGINVIQWDNESGLSSVSRLPDGELPNGGVPSPYIYDLLWDGELMWVASYGAGLFFMNPANSTGGFVPGADPQVDQDKAIGYHMHEADDRIWVGYTNGNFGYVQKRVDSTAFVDLTSSLPIDKSLTIMGVYADSALWLGTNKGLIHFAHLDSLVEGLPVSPRWIDRSTGLPTNTAYNILPDDEGALWVSTTGGILKMDPDGNSWKLFDRSIGLKNPEFNLGASLHTTQGMMYMGCVAGLVEFDPLSVFPNSDAPVIRLSELQLFNQKVEVGHKYGGNVLLTNDIDYVSSLTFSHAHHVFSFVFDAVNYRSHDQTLFAYQLGGLHDEWIYTAYPLATFTNIDPGEYELKFKAANNDGLWGEERQIQLIVLPPWWRTWWAYVLYAIAIGAGIWLITHLRVRSIRQMELVKQQTRETFRKRSRQDFHDEAGNKLTRIALVTQVARQQIKDKEQSKLIDEIDENIKELESGMRDFIWVLNPDEDNLFDTLERVRKFGQSMYEYADTRFEMDTPPEGWKGVALNMEKRRNLMMIFKEAINNSVKYAKASNARICYDGDDETPEMLFTDDGVGFDESTLERKGGLENMKKRAQRIGVALTITSSKNKGTEIKLKL